MASTSIDVCLGNAGDFVIQSGDGVKLRMDKATLSASSPFFASMFSLPTSNSDIHTVTVVEDHQTLLAILQHLYPISKVEIGSIGRAIHLIRAADKLQFDVAADAFRSTLKGLLESESDPLRVWAVALYYNFNDIRQDAVRRFIVSTEKDSPRADVDELRFVTALDYSQLLKIRQGAKDKARQALSRLDWDCTTCYEINSGMYSTAEDEMFYDLRGAADIYRSRVQDIYPFSSKATSELLFEFCSRTSDCKECRERKSWNTLQFSAGYALKKILEETSTQETPKIQDRGT